MSGVQPTAFAAGPLASRPPQPNLEQGGPGVYYAFDVRTLYVWDGTAWNALGKITSIVAGTGIVVTNGSGPTVTVAT